VFSQHALYYIAVIPDRPTIGCSGLDVG